MEPLVPLCNLEAIEINATPLGLPIEVPGVPMSGYLVFSPGRDFVERLENRHQLLRRVLLTHRHQSHAGRLTGRASFLWERGGEWERRPAPYLEYWDIICDRVGHFST
jgi:hypothetical protein